MTDEKISPVPTHATQYPALAPITAPGNDLARVQGT